VVLTLTCDRQDSASYANVNLCEVSPTGLCNEYCVSGSAEVCEVLSGRTER